MISDRALDIIIAVLFTMAVLLFVFTVSYMGDLFVYSDGACP